jgi:3-oxoacyl-[acyl-carrier protein] reductase
METIGAPPSYSSAKAALMAYVKNLSHKIGPHGVRVNCIAPGNIMFSGSTWENKLRQNQEETHSMLIQKVPLQCFGKPEDIANACLFLSSDVAQFITGHTLVVDGGQTISV